MLPNNTHASSAPQPLEYAPAVAMHVRSATLAVLAAVVSFAGAMAIWCTLHTIVIVLAEQDAVRYRAIDFDATPLGISLEKAIPLAVLSGGVAFVALVQLIRLINRRRCNRSAKMP